MGVKWLKTVSLRQRHLETRTMEAHFLSHELVRTFTAAFAVFIPAPFGDWGYLMRKMTDASVKYVRLLLNVYFRAGGNETVAQFQVRAFKLVRLLNEENVRRSLMGEKDPMRRAAFCSLAVTMKRIEEVTRGMLEQEQMGIFLTFTEDSVIFIAERVRDGTWGTCRLQMMPSYQEVSRMSDLKMEVLSLAPVRVVDDAIRMTNEEIRACIEANRGEPIPEATSLPGLLEESAFLKVFQQ